MREIWPECPWRVGDPDPTPDFADSCCPAVDEEGYSCTWGEDGVDGYQHPAWHVAGTSVAVVAVWPYKEWTD